MHSELLGAYPWSTTTPAASGNLPDIAAFENNGLTFIDRGTLTGGEPHDYTALVASTRVPDAGESAPASAARSRARSARTATKSAPSVCDDGPFGKGTGGQLRYRVTLGSRTAQTVWVAVAGSDRGIADAKKELAKALADPDAQLAAKIAERDELAARSTVDLPGDRKLQEALDWGKQNLADLTQTATNLQIRFVDQGKAFPAPVHNVKRATFIGAGYPDYPWLFATDGEYTAFAGGRARPVRGDQDPPERAARDLRRPQRQLRQGRARDRHRRLGLLRRQRRPGQHRRVGQVPVRGRARLALDRRRPLPRPPLRLLAARAAVRHRASSTPTRTAGPKAWATSSARAWARRSSTTPST